jgi:hypothetical protein
MMALAHRKRGYRLAALAAAGLAACQAGINSPAGDSASEIITLASGTQCGRSTTAPAASWLDSADALQHAYQRMTRQSLDAPPLPPQTPDFAQYGVLQVFMGQQSTGGYRLRLLHPRLEHSASLATVRVEWLLPPPGALTPQVITSPCLLLAIPRGSYRSLTVTDQSGRARAVAGL